MQDEIQDDEDDFVEPKNEMFYTEGSDQLKQARMAIANFSIPRAQKRLQMARDRRNAISNTDLEDVKLQDYLNSIPQYDIKAS